MHSTRAHMPQPQSQKLQNTFVADARKFGVLYGKAYNVFAGTSASIHCKREWWWVPFSFFAHFNLLTPSIKKRHDAHVVHAYTPFLIQFRVLCLRAHLLAHMHNTQYTLTPKRARTHTHTTRSAHPRRTHPLTRYTLTCS